MDIAIKTLYKILLYEKYSKKYNGVLPLTTIYPNGDVLVWWSVSGKFKPPMRQLLLKNEKRQQIS